MEELWKPISGFKYYSVSSYGRVKRLPHKIRNSCTGFRMLDELIMKPYIDFDGYEIIGLMRNSGDAHTKGYRVHRLVASAFLPNPQNLPEVNHKDGNKRNNNVENLEWTTHAENVKHAKEFGLREYKGLKICCCETGQVFKSIAEAARYYNVSSDVISLLVHKSTKQSKKLPNKHFEFI